LPPGGSLDTGAATAAANAVGGEIKAWQAIRDHLRNLPAKKGGLPVIPVDEHANEARAIKVA